MAETEIEGTISNVIIIIITIIKEEEEQQEEDEDEHDISKNTSKSIVSIISIF